MLLYQLYAFLIPALKPQPATGHQTHAPRGPRTFVAGVLFGYFVVLPAAVRFFENFNASQFNVLVQASQYYHFAAMTVLAMGLLFQVPVAIIAATSAEIVTARQLRHNRRYAILACVGIVALLPGTVTTMVLETVPLYILFEISLALAGIADSPPPTRPRPRAPARRGTAARAVGAAQVTPTARARQAAPSPRAHARFERDLHAVNGRRVAHVASVTGVEHVHVRA